MKPETLHPTGDQIAATQSTQNQAFAELEQSVKTALKTYSNVHRGSGHNSMVSTQLFDKAREIILDFLNLNKTFEVIFCTPARAHLLQQQIPEKDYQIISSKDIGLSIGITALAVKKHALPKGIPFQTGGGTTKLIAKGWVIWAGGPDKFEAGTPAIINVIAFAKALLLTQKYGKDIFLNSSNDNLTIDDILYKDEWPGLEGRELLNQLKQTLIGHGKNVPTRKGTVPFINFDNSASTPTFQPVWNAFRKTWRQSETIQKQVIEASKAICHEFLAAPEASFDMIFTSNTTEAINLAAENLGKIPNDDTETVIVNTIMEHSSNDLPWRNVPNSSLIRLSVDEDGFIDFNELESLLQSYNEKQNHGKKRIKLVAVSGASNVLGSCNDINEISRIVHKYGAQLLIDAAQLAAHRKIDMQASGIDFLAFSAHKVYAPFGTGVLLARKQLLNFNNSELKQIKASGEENACGIAALGKSLNLLQRTGMDLIAKEEQELTAKVLRGMAKVPGLTMFGIQHPDNPGFDKKLGVVAFQLKVMETHHVGAELATQGGIGVRYGCHCAHLIVKDILNISPGLEKFQRVIQTVFPRVKFPGVVRVSFGIENTEAEVDALLDELHKIANKSRDTQNGYLSKREIKFQMNKFVEDSCTEIYDL